MLNIMEDYVTYEQAELLKELGFDWDCLHGYYRFFDNKEPRLNTCGYAKNSIGGDFFYCAAPTLSQVQKWFREVKGIIIYPEPRFYKGKKPLLGYNYHLFDKDSGYYSHIESETVYDTYEQACSAGIDKAIELLKEENNGK